VHVAATSLAKRRCRRDAGGQSTPACPDLGNAQPLGRMKNGPRTNSSFLGRVTADEDRLRTSTTAGRNQGTADLSHGLSIAHLPTWASPPRRLPLLDTARWWHSRSSQSSDLRGGATNPTKRPLKAR
jgi:hypothetical protein